MKMKKIIAPTMAQAIEKVKQELGSDAVIFHTKKVTTGKFFNLFKKENVEVLAASDAEMDMQINKPSKITDVRDKEVMAHHHSPADSGMPFRRVNKKVDRFFSAPVFVEELRGKLLEQGVLNHDLDALTQVLIKKWYQSDERMTREEMVQVLKGQLIQNLDPTRFQASVLHDRYIMLVGPTGVGKTTTLAKLASRAVLDEGKKIAFITTDTYRIAAIDQLKMYANILGVPIEIAYTDGDFHQLMQKLAHFDQIFIDTAGRNFKKGAYINELIRLIHDESQIGMFLVLSATMKCEDMNMVIEQFDSLHLSHLILTKMDETLSYGSVISMLLKHRQLTVSYITNGQDVPDDLSNPNLRELINQLLGDSNGE
ncbi:flagellar biosynthesis protein FlhF [Sporolactobacillus shoreicorticis]|uniref:Flagellar biosynthesis protein FlhF n=1 Tax=Sporolactobacillus shoreicorticis TaxID=1923877 RepID=A0ABW5S7Z4_9BACL|nr:flagellar biosynthesis protein FlhF [Sporolactobacillus shoreicorticis]MCO7125979.1 flagellar biosynthesis protein FlhF [Sporolactobacillus shoreicorticis]